MKQLEAKQGAERGSTAYLVMICLVATLGGLLFGYDTAVISGAIGFLQTHFELTASMKGWAASSALVGCFLGVALAGEMNDRLGRRTTLLISAVLFLVSAIGSAVPETLTQFVAFRVIGGLGVGIASMTSPMYIAEISPARIRGRMVSLNQFAIVFGMLVVYFVNFYISSHGTSIDQHTASQLMKQLPLEVVLDEQATRIVETRIANQIESWNVVSGWRWMFGSEALPALLLLGLLLVVPESPRFLTKQGRGERARAILARIGGPSQAAREMAEIEASLAAESASLAQLFRPGMRIVLWIGIALAVLQQVTGINVFLYYAPEILKDVAGKGMDIALMQTILVGAVNLGFTVLAIWTVDKLGRKPLMIVGSIGMGIALAAIGTAAYTQNMGSWLLVFMLGYIACFALSVGPVTWVILSEIFPTMIRGRAMAIATFFLWVANYVVSQTFPMMDAGDSWLVKTFHHGFPFWVYGAFCIVLAVFVWKVVPETKGKSLEEIEKLWMFKEACGKPSIAENSKSG